MASVIQLKFLKIQLNKMIDKNNPNYWKCLHRLKKPEIEKTLESMGWEKNGVVDKIVYRHVFIKRPSAIAAFFGAEKKYHTIISDSKYLDASQSTIKGFHPLLVIHDKVYKDVWTKKD